MYILYTIVFRRSLLASFILKKFKKLDSPQHLTKDIGAAILKSVDDYLSLAQFEIYM